MKNKIEKIVIIVLVALFVSSAVALVAASVEEHRVAAKKVEAIEAEAIESIKYEVDIDSIYYFIHGFKIEEAMDNGIKDGDIVVSPSGEKLMVKYDHETNLVDFMSTEDIKNNIILKISTVVYLILILFLSIFLVGFVLVFLIEEHKKNKAIEKKIAEAKREAKAARAEEKTALEAEAESLIKEAASALAYIEDNNLVVFNTYSLEYELKKCCRYASRDNIDNLKEALDNLTYRC